MRGARSRAHFQPRSGNARKDLGLLLMEWVLPVLIASKDQGGYVNILDPFREMSS